MLQKYNTI